MTLKIELYFNHLPQSPLGPYLQQYRQTGNALPCIIYTVLPTAPHLS